MIFEFFSDPAFPPFYFTPGWISRALGKSDADFVSFFLFQGITAAKKFNFSNSG